MRFTLSEEQMQKIAGGNRQIALGDLIAKVTKAVGIKPCAGCKRRQKSLNRFAIRW